MHLSLQSLQAALEPLVEGQLHLAEDMDAVAGVRPQIVVEPGSEAEVASVLAFAHREGLCVLPRGGGTQLALGAPPTRVDILLSTVRLQQVIEHAPHDQTVTVEAGLPLATLQATLAQQKQWLALDPELDPAATIGGIVATNATGPRRLRYGGVRDQIIGIRVVLPDGTIAKGGGKVVKNVAGYDLPKLFTGALGTLGIIVSASFRLYPLPAASRTVYLTVSALASCCDLAVHIIGSTLVPTAINIHGDTTQNGMYSMGVRFEMSQETADAQAAEFVVAATRQIGQVLQAWRILHDDAEKSFWSPVSPSKALADTTQSKLTFKASLLPTDLATWLTHLEQLCSQLSLQATWHAYAGHGIIFVHITGDEEYLIRAVQELRCVATERQGSLVVIDAAPDLTSNIDVWGPVPALSVVRSLKARFDPHTILNPGRFVGGI